MFYDTDEHITHCYYEYLSELNLPLCQQSATATASPAVDSKNDSSLTSLETITSLTKIVKNHIKLIEQSSNQAKLMNS